MPGGPKVIRPRITRGLPVEDVTRGILVDVEVEKCREIEERREVDEEEVVIALPANVRSMQSMYTMSHEISSGFLVRTRTERRIGVKAKTRWKLSLTCHDDSTNSDAGMSPTFLPRRSIALLAEFGQ